MTPWKQQLYGAVVAGSEKIKLKIKLKKLKRVVKDVM